MVIQEIGKRPKDAGKQLRLFEDEGIYKNYRYSFCNFLPNLKGRFLSNVLTEV